MSTVEMINGMPVGDVSADELARVFDEQLFELPVAENMACTAKTLDAFKTEISDAERRCIAAQEKALESLSEESFAALDFEHLLKDQLAAHHEATQRLYLHQQAHHALSSLFKSEFDSGLPGHLEFATVFHIDDIASQLILRRFNELRSQLEKNMNAEEVHQVKVELRELHACLIQLSAFLPRVLTQPDLAEITARLMTAELSKTRERLRYLEAQEDQNSSILREVLELRAKVDRLQTHMDLMTNTRLEFSKRIKGLLIEAEIEELERRIKPLVERADELRRLKENFIETSSPNSDCFAEDRKYFDQLHNRYLNNAEYPDEPSAIRELISKIGEELSTLNKIKMRYEALAPSEGLAEVCKRRSSIKSDLRRYSGKLKRKLKQKNKTDRSSRRSPTFSEKRCEDSESPSNIMDRIRNKEKTAPETISEPESTSETEETNTANGASTVKRLFKPMKLRKEEES